MRHKPIAVVFVACALTLALSRAPQQAQLPEINRAYLDTTCAPCDDFWRFANGAWIDSAQFPTGRGTIGRDAGVGAQNAVVIRAVLDSLAYAPERHARTRQDRNVGRFYAACMDTTRSSAEELLPLAPELQALSSITTMSEVSETMGRLTALRLQPLFWLVVVPDPPDPTRHIAEIRGVDGWSIGVRVYTATDTTSERILAAYTDAVAGVLRLLGQSPEAAIASSRSVLAIETAIVRAQPTGNQGPLVPHSLDELHHLVPAFDWHAFARGLGRPGLERIDSRQAERVIIDTLVRSFSIDQWRAYLTWQFAHAIAPITYRSLNATLRPFRAVQTGAQGQPPRASLCVPYTTQWMGDGVARAYVARAFSPDDRAAALALVERMRAVFRERLATLEWLSPQTRQRAVAKLDSMQLQNARG